MLSDHLDTIKSALEDKRRIVGDTPEIDAALAHLDSLAAQPVAPNVASMLQLAEITRKRWASDWYREGWDALHYERAHNAVLDLLDVIGALQGQPPQQPGNPLGDYRDVRGILPHDPAAPTSVERLRRLREEYEQDAPQD